MFNVALQKPPLSVLPGHDLLAKAFDFKALSPDLPALQKLWSNRPRNRVLTLSLPHVKEYMRFLRERFHPALKYTVGSNLLVMMCSSWYTLGCV